MVNINEEGEFKIVVRSCGHNPPHIHVFRGSQDILKIDFTPPSLTVLEGKYPKGKKSQIVDSILDNYQKIVKEWNKCNPDCVTKIDED